MHEFAKIDQTVAIMLKHVHELNITLWMDGISECVFLCGVTFNRLKIKHSILVIINKH